MLKTAQKFTDAWNTGSRALFGQRMDDNQIVCHLNVIDYLMPANTAASHSLPLPRAKGDEVSHVLAGANERRLYSQARITANQKLRATEAELPE